MRVRTLSQRARRGGEGMEKPGRSLDDGQGQGSDKPRVTGRPRTGRG